MQLSLIRPHLIRLSEHHLREQEIKKNLSLNNYRLASSFCREGFSEVGVCIMTRKDINFNTVNLNEFCSAKTFEACASKVNTNMIKIIVCCIYRSPSRNVDQFFKLLEETKKAYIILASHFCFVVISIYTFLQ